MNTKHTPGPWHINNEDTADVVFFIGGKSGSIGSCFNSGGGVGIQNARLIAAAPDLLDTLHLVVSMEKYAGRPYSVACLAAQQAIERATREG